MNFGTTPSDPKDCPHCKRLQRGLTWVGDPFDPEQRPKCPAHSKHSVSYVR